jgi:hypothetical protein
MSIENIRPSTLEGIKRHAHAVKAEHGMRHMQALDAVAQAAGYQNFRHARRVLRERSPAPEARHPRHRIYLTAYWKDVDSGGSGRETLSLEMPCRWGELITPGQFGNHRALVHFRAEGPDHLAIKHLQRTQSEARRAVCAAARTLQFMEATRLRPSKSHSRVFPGGQSGNAIPGRDHYSVWYARDTKRYLFVDEPYEEAAKAKSAERQAWAEKYGFMVIKSTWPGMYAPDLGTRLYLVADSAKGAALAPIAAALDLLASPIVEKAWCGESAAMLPLFVTPGAQGKLAVAKGKPPAARKATATRNTVAYVQTFVGPRRRPMVRMPLEAHAEVGRLLKSVLIATYHRKGVYNRVNAVRSELDEWTQREYDHAELPNERFFELYYHEAGSAFGRALTVAERARHGDSLSRARQILSAHYPDCAPLRSLLMKIDAALKSLQTWI